MSEPTWPPAPLRWPDPALADRVVMLDALRDEDAEAVAAGASDAHTARWLPVPVPYSVDDAHEFMALQRELAAAGTLLALAIRRSGEPALVGAIAAHLTGRVGECELGYWLHPAARGQGLTPRALRLMAGHVFSTLPVHRVELLVHPANVASRRVCAAVGCAEEGLRRAAARKPRGPGYEPMLVYSLLPGDLP